MRYAFPQYFRSKARFLSYTVVYKALVDAGHEVVEDINGADAVLFSMCDVVEYRQLMRMRKESACIPLIVGGAYAFNFWSAKLYSDAVWVGEVYEMAEFKTLDDLMESPHCYTGGELPIASQQIDWEKVPIAQIDKNKCYYWGGVGCSNHCRFCFTSWTHRHQVNSRARIAAARREAKRRKVHLMISSNEYDNDPGSSTFDMLLETYIKVPVNANIVRCGIEFATDESRKRNGKQITENQIFHALQKSMKERTSLRLFHIAGYDELSDWERYIDTLCDMCDRIRYSKFLNLIFNNLQYQNYTPLYAERRNIDPDKYITKDDTCRWYNRLRSSTGTVLVGAPSPFQHVCCRMGIELSTTRDQVDFWASMLVNPAKKLTKKAAYDSLFDSGIMDTPPLVLIPSTGRIEINDKWR